MLSFKFGADGSEYSKGLDKMRKNTSSWAGSVKGMIGGALGGAVLIGGLKKMADSLDRVGKLSTRLGKSAEDLQRIGLVAELAGSDMERLAKGLTMVEVNAGKAAEGSKILQESFSNMGIDIEEYRKADLVGQLGMLSDGFLLAEQNGTGFNDLQNVMGGSAKELIPLLRQGSDAITEQAEAAKVASNEMVEQSQAVNDQFTMLKNKAMGFFFSIYDGFKNALPYIKGFGKEIAINVGLTIEKAIVHASALLKVLHEMAHFKFGSITEDYFMGIAEKMSVINEKGALMKKNAEDETQNDVESRAQEDAARKKKLEVLANGRKIAAAAEATGGDDDAAAKLKERERKIDEANAFAKMDDKEKLKFLQDQQKGLFDSGTDEDRIKGKEMQQRIDRLAGSIKAGEVSDEPKEVEPAKKKKIKEKTEEAIDQALGMEDDTSSGGGGSNLISSALQSIGGGGGFSMLGDPQLDETKKTNNKLDTLIANTTPAGGSKEVEI